MTAYLDLSAQDPRVHVRAYDGMALWLLGYPDQASRICGDALRYAQASQNPFSEAIARTIGLRVHQFRGEAEVVVSQANTAIALCEQHEFVHYLAMALVLRGWANAQLGEFEKGIIEIQDGLKRERAIGALLFESYALGLLADACLKNKKHAQALDYLEQAELRIAEENSERYYAAEVYRLLGETYLRSSRELDKAEYYFLKSLKISHVQQARSFELRTSLSICDLYETSQKPGRYRSELGEIYGFFTEGLQTADLVRAKVKLKNIT